MSRKLSALLTLGPVVGFTLACGSPLDGAFDQAKADVTKLTIVKAAQLVEMQVLNEEKAPTIASSVTSLKDGWERPLIYIVPGPGDAAFDIISYGRDGAEGGSGLDADIRYSELLTELED